jgi:glycosyltransferase involved in cell wall biosynthesis
VLWVNTIGTRAPRFDVQTLKRVTEKLCQWGNAKRSTTTQQQSGSDSGPMHTHPNLTVINPKMWPWFSSGRARQANRWLLARQLESLIAQLPQPVVGLTTLPITADLPDALAVDRWVYYCVDDFSQWPGLDRDALRRMDLAMIQRADSVIAVSETLRSMIADEGRLAKLLTHGVDVEFWRSDFDSSSKPLEAPGPHVVFWGVIDRRMDSASLRQLSHDMTEGTIVLIGPQQDPDSDVLALPNVRTLPTQPLSALPAIAQQADVLIMPYGDLPVTRAMQPLKLKEYLATGKPVVVNRLPSTDEWSDCLDAAETPEQFSRLVRERIKNGIPAPQVMARSRLQRESWKSKAEVLEEVLQGGES